MTAVVFVLCAQDAGPIAGAALVCPGARYLSLRSVRADRLERHFAMPADWKALEAELYSLRGGLLPMTSAVVRVLGLAGNIEAVCQSKEEITADSAARLVHALDARLSAEPLEEGRIMLQPRH